MALEHDTKDNRHPTLAGGPLGSLGAYLAVNPPPTPQGGSNKELNSKLIDCSLSEKPYFFAEETFRLNLHYICSKYIIFVQKQLLRNCYT